MRIIGKQVIDWLDSNEIGRLLLAESYGGVLENSDEDDTYDECMKKSLDELRNMEIFK
jgi:hypothetical protein